MTQRTVSEGLQIDPEAIAGTLERFIQQQVSGNGFQRVVLGLSGGADSAVVAALCSRALGPDHVHPYMMPYKTSGLTQVKCLNSMRVKRPWRKTE